MNLTADSPDATATDIFSGLWWSVRLPKGWVGNLGEECATFLREPQGGALQISSARRDTGPVSDEDLKEFAQGRISSGIGLVKTSCGLFLGFSAEYTKEGRYWKEWWLRSGNLMVYATYNVIQGKEGPEKCQLGGILESLRPIQT